MLPILVILSVIAGLVGLFLLTQATWGVGLIGFACLLGILARIQQASLYQEKMGVALSPRPAAAPPAPPREDPGPTIADDPPTEPYSGPYEEKRILSAEMRAYTDMGWRVLSNKGASAIVARGQRSPSLG
jgi:hypothetical protein